MTKKEKIVIGETDALIIIDGQNDFVTSKGALYVAGVKGECLFNMQVADMINTLYYQPFGYKITTEDKHPENHIEHGIFGKHCLAGTVGQKYGSYFEGIYNTTDERIIKGEHPAIISYSVATSPQFPEHIANLRKKGIKRVFVVGWAYTHCVGESAIAYACQGFETYVIRDLTRSVPPPYGDPIKTKKKLALYGVKEIYLKDIK